MSCDGSVDTRGGTRDGSRRTSRGEGPRPVTGSLPAERGPVTKLPSRREGPVTEAPHDDSGEDP